MLKKYNIIKLSNKILYLNNYTKSSILITYIMKKLIILFIIYFHSTISNGQVELYSDLNFTGPKKTISSDWSVSGMTDSWNDLISSIKIPEGWEITVYSDMSYGGASMTLNRNWTVANWQDGWNDQISSIRIRKKGSITNAPVASRKKIWLENLRLCCDKTTEQGADEIYMIITAKSSRGTIITKRLPEENDHFDMNDGDQPTNNYGGDSHCISDGFKIGHIFESYISSGETWNIDIIVMEEDGGTTKTAQEIGSALLIETGDPYAATAGEIISVLTGLGVYAKDKNDYVGSIALRVNSDNNGNITNSYRIIDRGRITSFPIGGTRRVEGRLDGDGTDYLFEFILQNSN